MPDLFTVTTATNTLHLDRKRQGEAAFTVTNASGRPLRGRALLLAEDPTAEGWLSLDGEPERNFPVASTEQFDVRINVPPEGKAGSYPFRLDMVNVKRTDEDYSRGQSITLEVPEAEPETKSFPTWILLVAVAVLLLGVFVFRCPIFGCGPSTVTVPGGLEGLSVSQAMDVLDEQGLSVAEEIRSEPSHTIDDGMVIRTDPASGEEVRPDTEITLVVSATLAFLRQWGAEGSGEGQFMLPAGIAVSREGNVYVTDRDRDREIHRVQVFSPEGRFLRQWGEYGAQEGQFAVPVGVAVDRQGNVYVGDGGNRRVQVFSPEGRFLRQWGEMGHGVGQFISPQAVAVDEEDNVYVVDVLNNRVQVFGSDGRFRRLWGESGDGEGQFRLPNGVAVNPDGHVYIADRMNNRVQVFSPEGRFLRRWGERGRGEGQFRSPYAVATDEAGNVYVADGGNNRVQVFSPEGRFLRHLGEQGSGEGQFRSPMGVAVDAEGNVYVLDRGNHRVQVFGWTTP